jgi:hypothetical protein
MNESEDLMKGSVYWLRYMYKKRRLDSLALPVNRYDVFQFPQLPAELNNHIHSYRIAMFRRIPRVRLSMIISAKADIYTLSKVTPSQWGEGDREIGYLMNFLCRVNGFQRIPISYEKEVLKKISKYPCPWCQIHNRQHQ